MGRERTHPQDRPRPLHPHNLVTNSLAVTWRSLTTRPWDKARRSLVARDRRIHRHRHSNAKSEGINRVIKLVARNVFGFRNADYQRLRTRCVITRRARGHLRTAQL
ncbi:transposase [Streptomyces viridosporus]|uniref:transposase n=1 Tax=Streptomyces viridosporus TaxID=67581 RepID=UPI0036F67609